MNIEHRTSNIEHRMRNGFAFSFFKKDRIPFSMLDVRSLQSAFGGFDIHLLKHLSLSIIFTFILAITCTLTILPIPSYAADDTSLDEALEGFDDDAVETKEDSIDDVIDGFDDDTAEGESDTAESDQNDTPSRYPTFSMGGAVRMRAFYNYAKHAPETGETDWRGFSSLRGDLLLEADSKLGDAWQAKVTLWGYYDLIYDINGWDEYTRDVTDTYITDLELRDTYIQGSLLPYLDIKVGRQIVVWGKSDNLRVCDVLNPLYLREVGMTDIRDLRLPVTMTRLDYYWSNWNVSAMAIPEIRFNELPVYGGDYYFQDAPLPDEDVPDSGIENMEYALSVNGIFSGWDISFYYANIYDDAPYLYVDYAVSPPEPILKHARLTLFGAAWNLAVGNWLIKAESAHFQGLRYYNTPGQTYDRTDILAGLEYSGFKEISISFEALNRYLHDYDDALKDPPVATEQNESQYAARLTKDWLNDTLTLTLLASAYGVDFLSGSFERFALEYDLTDAWIVNGGLVLYQSGEKTEFQHIGDSDRVFLEVKYSF